MRLLNKGFLAGLVVLLLSGCGTTSSDESSPASSASPSGDAVIVVGNEQPSGGSPITSDIAEDNPDYALIRKAQDIVDILRSRDLERLAQQIDPEHGLRFSPYAYIDTDHTQRFTADELPDFQRADKLIWGSYDGSGEPIELSFREYFEKFVYDHDFASAPTVSANLIVSHGNAPFNALDIYPDAAFVEFHYPGFDKKLEGMDWKSLIIVLRPAGTEWKVCAIVHSQWTI